MAKFIFFLLNDWKYSRDMIVDKPIENKNMNYESYLQLDHTVYSFWVHLILALRSAARRRIARPFQYFKVFWTPE